MSLKKSFLAILGAGVCIISVTLGWYHLTSGFKVSKTVFNNYQDIFYQNRFEKGDFYQLEKILQQKFVFLGKGCQVYAFVSDDGRYVLKLLKLHRFRSPFRKFFKAAVLKRGFATQEDEIKDLQNRQKKRLFSAFTNYRLAMDALKEETALVYAHFNPEFKLPKIQVQDRLGRCFWLDLNKTFFLIQKKARELKAQLLFLRQKQKTEEAKKIIDWSVAHLKRRLNCQIFESDQSGYVRNLGLLNEKAISIDVGNFKQRKEASKEELITEYKCCLNRLYSWAEKNYPEIADYIKEKCQEQIFLK